MYLLLEIVGKVSERTQNLATSSANVFEISDHIKEKM